MKAKLIVMSGGVQSTEIDLQLPVSLGRGRQAGIMLPHSLISRQHCEIYEVDDQLVVRDLGSMNGTLVNRRQIDEPTVLRSGDILTLGPVTFRVDYIDACTTKADAADETAISKRGIQLRQEAAGTDSSNPPSIPIQHLDSGILGAGLVGAAIPSASAPDLPSTVAGTPPTESAPPTPDDGLDEFLRNLK